MMWQLAFTLAVLAAAGQACANDVPLTADGMAEVDARPHLTSSYCQNPDYVGVYNVSSGFGSEIADDIPDALAGQVIEQVTLWVGEFYGPWQDPTGVQVSFYDGACPPAVESSTSFMIPWTEWDTQLVYTGTATVYEATAALPEAVEIREGTSIGGYVVIPWGQDEPFAGLCSTPEWAISGCGEAYLDAAWWGYPRWSPTSYYTQIPRDFAYCLTTDDTSLDDTAPAVALSCRPNPFGPSTTIHFALAIPSHVSVGIHDAAGRCVAELADGTYPPGEHALCWDGTDGGGKIVSRGVYFARLVAGSRHRAIKLVLTR